MSDSINGHVLMGTNPCINKATHVLLMQGILTLHMHILGPGQKFMSSTVTCIEVNITL